MSTYNPKITQAQLQLPAKDLVADMDFLVNLGFRLDKIFPADDPKVAILSGYGLQLALDRNTAATPAIINLITDNLEHFEAQSYIAPSGTRFNIVAKTKTLITPDTQHKFEVRKLSDQDSWVIGRAGMLYRDLIPDRLGGSIIASHIRIPEGGPVPDMVHYHTIGFQLIYCYSGWVKLVYEDQGEPFILRAGDCVTQPPEIRHRVLEASDGLEVIEIGVPAEHITTIDHEMELPTKTHKPNRVYHGQTFCHHKLQEAVWQPWRTPGFEYRDTGIYTATAGDASVHIARPLETITEAQLEHHTDIQFTFVLSGRTQLIVQGEDPKPLKKGDAFVIPPEMEYRFREISADLELLEVALPGHIGHNTK